MFCLGEEKDDQIIFLDQFLDKTQLPITQLWAASDRSFIAKLFIRRKIYSDKKNNEESHTYTVQQRKEIKARLYRWLNHFIFLDTDANYMHLLFGKLITDS